MTQPSLCSTPSLLPLYSFLFNLRGYALELFFKPGVVMSPNAYDKLIPLFLGENGAILTCGTVIDIFFMGVFGGCMHHVYGIIQILLAHSGSVTVRPLVLVLEVQSSLQEQYNKISCFHYRI